MCGNALRCLVRLINLLGESTNQLTIETQNNIYPVSLKEDCVSVVMGPPKDVQWNISLSFLGHSYLVQHLNTGVPHAVLFVDDVDVIPIESWGPALRHHPQFGTAGANANFAHVHSGGKICLRTYERGVEGETLACGTGATATAIAAAHLFGLTNPLQVETRSKEILTIQIDPMTTSMTGPARILFTGEYHMDRSVTKG